jgi:hypothetical protein
MRAPETPRQGKSSIHGSWLGNHIETLPQSGMARKPRSRVATETWTVEKLTEEAAKEAI